MTKEASGLIDVAKLILRFAKTNRTTFLDDGVSPESDTDHTMMLCTSACALAQKMYPDLDIGLVAQFGIVHDLVEAYAEDTDSFGITKEEEKDKENREQEAFIRIRKEFKEVYPWIPKMIEKYEALDTKESRFVKVVDKMMTRLTHIHNKGAYFKSRNLKKEDVWEFHRAQTKKSKETYGSEFSELLALNEELMEEAVRAGYEN